MSPAPRTPGPVRSAADLNRLIRALWRGGVLTDRERYHQLVVEWARADEAERRDVVKAA
jgi:hypothetical protein